VQHSFANFAWILLAALLSVLPFTVHRLVSPRLPGFISTLPFPLASIAIPSLAFALHIGETPHHDLQVFTVAWFAATLVWMWNRESGATPLFFAAGLVLAAGYRFLPHTSVARLSDSLNFGANFSSICLAALLVLIIWAPFRPTQVHSWAKRLKTISVLRSPFTKSLLHVGREQNKEVLVSSADERFPIRHGIPAFLRPENLTGDNLKYNHVYETIGGFYDDIQRVFCGLKGYDRDAHFRSYMHLLEVKPGQSVLETSVGTGLNFKYLPRGVKLSGLDLSPEMLMNCQANLRRWNLDADLYLGNAESLPFADSSFDVVFHVGGINFFNDRAKAIREMIRVAKPGSLLLISDETEKHVKQVYEKSPGGLWKNRKAPVAAPIDLVPTDMLDIRLVELRDGDIYALTFRKPATA
jgi:ubiquinone/menaquinone biosynthesis C-methylase UbiE